MRFGARSRLCSCLSLVDAGCRTKRRCSPVLRIASILVLLGLLTDVHPARATEWTPLASLSEGRFGASAAAQGDRLFVLGGYFNPVIRPCAAWNRRGPI